MLKSAIRRPKRYICIEEKKIDGRTKKLLKLEGWRQTLLDALIDGKSETELIDLIPKSSASRSGETKEVLIGYVPKRDRGRANIFLNWVLSALTFNEAGRVVYPDGSTGSALIDHLLFWTSSSAGKFGRRQPGDTPKFAQLLIDSKIPSSAVAKDPEQYRGAFDWIKI